MEASGVLHTPAHKAPKAQPPDACRIEGCGCAAQCVPVLYIYPPKAVMDHYRTTEPLNHMLMNLPLCLSCVEQMTFRDVITRDSFMTVAKLVEEMSGTAVDPEGTKLGSFPLDHPEYLQMKQEALTKGTK